MGGPTFRINVSSPSPSTNYARDRSGVVSSAPIDKKQQLLSEDDVNNAIRNEVGSGFGIGLTGKGTEEEEEESVESSSSIGAPSEEDEEDNDDVSSKEVQSNFKRGLGSLSSLEETLPIKRGLSNHFIGKSKSFANLSDVGTVKDLEKQENPFNKRRRVLIASKWSSKRTSFYSSNNPKSMPLLALNEDGDEDEDENEHQERQEYPSSSSSSSSPSSSTSTSTSEKKEQEGDQKLHERIPSKLHDRRLLSFKSRCFSLSDLQEREEEDDDD